MRLPPHASITIIPYASVEYFQARPNDVDHDLAQQLAMETAGQHEYVVAQTADQSLDAVSDQGVPVALESGYLIDAMI